MRAKATRKQGWGEKWGCQDWGPGSKDANNPGNSVAAWWGWAEAWLRQDKKISLRQRQDFEALKQSSVTKVRRQTFACFVQGEWRKRRQGSLLVFQGSGWCLKVLPISAKFQKVSHGCMSTAWDTWKMSAQPRPWAFDLFSFSHLKIEKKLGAGKVLRVSTHVWKGKINNSYWLFF